MRKKSRHGQAPPPRAFRQTGRGERGAAPRPAGGGAHVALLYGFHSVREVLRSGRRRPLALFATAAAAERLAVDVAGAGIAPQLVTAEDISRRLGAGAVHQGVLLEAEPLPALTLDDIAPRANLVLVLDQITDPHNVGAIIRTAAAFGAEAIVTTERHAPEFGGILAKAASGGLEYLAIVTVVNLARALDELKDFGYLRVGLDSEAPVDLRSAPLARPLALVLGAEDKGLRRLTRENCDMLARLDMPGAIKSLNVSNACAVALSIVTIALAPKSPN